MYIYRVIRFKTLERDSRNLLRMSEARDWTQTISKDCSPSPLAAPRNFYK